MYGLSRCCSVTCPTCGLCCGTVTFLRDAMCSLHVSRRVQVLRFTLSQSLPFARWAHALTHRWPRRRSVANLFQILVCLYHQVKLGLLTWQSGRKEKKRQTEAKFINSRPRLLTRIVSRGRFFLKPRRSGQTAFAFDYSGKKIKRKWCNFLVSCEKKFTEYKQCKCFIFHKMLTAKCCFLLLVHWCQKTPQTSPLHQLHSHSYSRKCSGRGRHLRISFENSAIVFVDLMSWWFEPTAGENFQLFILRFVPPTVTITAYFLQQRLTLS